jgi:HK97 family phage major capsid protein
MPNPVLQRLVDERSRLHENIDTLLGSIAEEERDPTDSERELLNRHRERLEALEPQVVDLVELEERRSSSRDARAALTTRAGSNEDDNDRSVTPTAPASSAPVYRTFAEWARDELVRRFDRIAFAAGPGAAERAAERLTRAAVHTTTSDVPGLLPPTHMAQILDVINKSRPIVESSRRASLTSGVLTYPRITSRPAVGKQPAEKQEFAGNEMTVAMIQATADTYIGAGNLSWQTINWSTPDALSLWFDLAAEAYAKQTESAAATELVAAATDDQVELGSDDLAGWYAALGSAAELVYTNSGRIADTIYAATDVAFRLAGFVSNNSPVFASGGSISLASGQGSVGGFRLVASRALASGVVVVGVSSSLLCAETPGAPVEMRAVEPSIGGMEVGIIGAFVAEAMDPEAFAQIVNLVP